MLAAALELQVSECVSCHQDRRDGAGLRQVVRNGKAQPRKVIICQGPPSGSNPDEERRLPHLIHRI